MTIRATRRGFLKVSTAAAVAARLVPRPADAAAAAEPGKPIRVVVWDERQRAQLQAYEDFLGNAIADHLRTRPGLEVKSVGIDDPDHGLGDGVLGPCDVLIWWGHARHAEIPAEVGKAIVGRIKAGTLSLIALHSAHWSTPFVEAMNERTRLTFGAKDHPDAAVAGPGERIELRYAAPPSRYTLPKSDARLTPNLTHRKFPDGLTKSTVQLPYCCFPAYRTDGKPSDVRVRMPRHPIVAGVPARFEIPRTEMYDEPFHVPAPDEVVLEERWAGGEWFRSGMVWRLEKGRVFYFRPGHETYPVFRQPEPLRILSNAARWLGSRPE